MVDGEEAKRRRAAIRRIKARRWLQIHGVVFGAVNAALLAIWALAGGGYFWPGWVLLGWGIGLAAHAIAVYAAARPITDDQIRAEMKRDGTIDPGRTPPGRAD